MFYISYIKYESSVCITQEAAISGLNSKTHMKIMLKWMRGRSMLKQVCNRVGNNKRFLVSTYSSEGPQVEETNNSPELTPKPNARKKSAKKSSKSQKKRAR